jgi:transglutaminase-like putative cysteine protease
MSAWPPLRAFGAMLAALCVAAQAAGAEWRLVEERFYAISLGGKPCGRSFERVETDGGRFRTSGQIALRFTRLGQETAVEFSSEFIETVAGKPLEASVFQGEADRVRYVFRDDGAGARRVVVERRNAKPEERALPEGDFLAPRAAREFIRAQQALGAAEIRYRILDAQSGLVPVDLAMTRKGAESRAVLGKTSDVVRYEVRNSLLPVSAQEVLDGGAGIVESTTPMGLGDLVSRVATKDEADAAYAAARFDILAKTFIETPPIVDFLERSDMTVIVRSTAGALQSLPDLGAQRVARVDERTLRVHVDVRRGSPGAAGDAADARFTKPSEMIDSADPAIMALLERAKLPAGADARARAESLRALVARHLSAKNLGSAFASASEAARSRSGDCTEHAVLLAALLRADGTPARVASGLVYVPRSADHGAGWGWHLWTQALVDVGQGRPSREWIDLDATIPASGPRFHAAHVLVSTSDLSGGAADPSFAQALSLLGTVSIEVETAQPAREGARESDAVGAGAP